MKTPVIASVAVGILVAVPLIHQSQRLRRIEAELDRPAPASESAASPRALDPNAASQRELDRLRAEQSELDRLRTEAAALRRQARDPERAAVAVARDGLRSVEAEAQALKEEEELRQSREAAINLLKNVGIAARIYSTENADRMPDRFEAMTEALGGTNSPLLAELDRYEFYPQPRRVSLNDPQLFLFREKQPRRRPDGRWERVYALVDGSVQLLESPTEDFTSAEVERGGVASESPVGGGGAPTP